MAEENVRITSPVKVASDSPHRVALDLAMQISYGEDVQQNRQYWLTLYRQCYKAVNGYPLEQVLEEQ